MAKSPITTHVLDTALGRPAAGLVIRLYRLEADMFVELASGQTDADGRITDLLEPGTLTPGTYRMRFATGPYLEASAGGGFYPEADVVFRVESLVEHYHIPLLLSPYGYSTYRGS